MDERLHIEAIRLFIENCKFRKALNEVLSLPTSLLSLSSCSLTCLHACMHTHSRFFFVVHVAYCMCVYMHNGFRQRCMHMYATCVQVHSHAHSLTHSPHTHRGDTDLDLYAFFLVYTYLYVLPLCVGCSMREACCNTRSQKRTSSLPPVAALGFR